MRRAEVQVLREVSGGRAYDTFKTSASCLFDPPSLPFKLYGRC